MQHRLILFCWLLAECATAYDGRPLKIDKDTGNMEPTGITGDLMDFTDIATTGKFYDVEIVNSLSLSSNLTVSGTGIVNRVWITNETVASIYDGALKVDGGIWGTNGLYVHTGSSIVGGTFFDGTDIAQFAVGGYSGYFYDNVTLGLVAINAPGVEALHIQAGDMQIDDGYLDFNDNGSITNCPEVHATNVFALGAYYVDGTQVVTNQQSAIADITVTGAARDGDARTKINDILAALRTHGLIAP